MSDHHIALIRDGDDQCDMIVVEGATSSPAAVIEVCIADAATWNRNDLAFALRKLAHHVETLGLATGSP